MKNNKRPQAQKPNRHVERVQGLRTSNAAGPHRLATNYSRRPKHVKKGYDSE